VVVADEIRVFQNPPATRVVRRSFRCVVKVDGYTMTDAGGIECRRIHSIQCSFGSSHVLAALQQLVFCLAPLGRRRPVDHLEYALFIAKFKIRFVVCRSDTK
jgi:hypothetical protein